MDILERFASSQTESGAAALLVRSYYSWQSHHRSSDFIPSADDDIDLRSYLFYMRSHGAEQAVLEDHADALKQFYQWMQGEGEIAQNPFDENDFLHPFLSNKLIEPRQQTISSDPNERELEWLRALYQIVEQLVSSVDIRSALDGTLETLLKVMNLQTGWVSILAESQLGVVPAGAAPPHGFVLAADYGLPPGLEHDNRMFLRKSPACQCQNLLKEGRLTRAVNIVECTRLRDSLQAAGDTQGLRFHATVPLISYGKPVGLINVATTDWQFLTHQDLHFLSAVSTRLTAAIERAHFYEVAESRRLLLEDELKIASEVQAGLMPREMPHIPGFRLASAWHPAREVAGDFYDIFPMGEGRWGMVIGDVADKGTAAALYMAMAHSLILSEAMRHRHPAAVLKAVNETILRQSAFGIFVTVFFAVLDTKQQTLTYANAGHNPPIVRRANGTIELLARTGTVVGVVKKLQISEETITIEQDDALVLYTDGVTEAWSLIDSDEFYGSDRLTAAITTAPRTASEIIAQIETDLKAFSNGTVPQDDITLLVVTKD